MPRIPRTSAAWIWSLPIIFAFGCGSSNNPAGTTPIGHQKQALMEVGELYRLASATAKKPPTSVKDFQGTQQIGPIGFQSVKDGSIVVLWGIPLADTSEEGSTDASDEVLAYEKAVPDQGGQVLMKNRTVQSMTAEQFKSAKKGGKG